MDQVVAALGEGPGRVRIEVRPAGRMAAFMEFLAQLAGEGSSHGWDSQNLRRRRTSYSSSPTPATQTAPALGAA
jgi:hypothetical protein